MEQDSNKKIIIRADRDLEDLIPGYLANRRRDIAEIDSLLASHDYDAIKRLGHSMRGSGGGYGFDEITRLGMLIEQFAKEENSAGIVEQLKVLAGYLDRVEVTYD
jgi:HPt (histidine-containing phosphotransfer) domain-containing protein